MVRLTADMLMRCSSSHVKKHRDESRKHFLRRLTHLHLENREIDNTVCTNIYTSLLTKIDRKTLEKQQNKCMPYTAFNCGLITDGYVLVMTYK